MKRINNVFDIFIKRMMLACLICTVNLTLFAQKEYVYVNMIYNSPSSNSLNDSKVNKLTMSGKLPPKMQLYNYVNVIDDNNISYFASYSGSNSDSNILIGSVLNELSANGFEMVFMNSYGNNAVCFVFSRDSSSPPTTVIQINQSNENEDEEVKEMARYNLQGLPVRSHEKGVQIIVYSNYTTRTIFVQ